MTAGTIKPRGVCPVCKETVALRTNGTSNKHGYANNLTGTDALPRRTPCAGSGKLVLTDGEGVVYPRA